MGADVDQMAERLGVLERARGEFVAKVSHDLRTPVTVIKGYAFTLARRGGDVDTLRRLTAISREADRLTALIEDLLTLSRAQAGALNLVWHPSEAAGLLEEVAERIGDRAAELRRGRRSWTPPGSRSTAIAAGSARCSRTSPRTRCDRPRRDQA